MVERAGEDTIDARVAEAPPWWRGERARIVVNVAATLAFLAYWTFVFFSRMRNAWGEYAIEGDQAQAVFLYWRYHLDDVLPPGNLGTDFVDVMHTPPFWWLLMASLSLVVPPLVAAKTLNVIALMITPAMTYLAARTRGNHLVGLAAAALLMRVTDYHSVTAGGYARTFGPFLVMLFLWAFMRRRHYTCLAILVWQASFYPSVVIPCGFAYGIYVVVAGPTMRDRLRRCAGMFVAGLLIIGFGKYQDIRRPDWWGPLVTKEEAAQSKAWSKNNGRFKEMPMRSLQRELKNQGNRMFSQSGPSLFSKEIVRWNREHWNILVWLPLIVSALVLLARRYRRWRGGQDPPPVHERFPWEIPLIAACAFVGLILARAVAYKLYMPVRVTAHTWPYLFYVTAPLVVWHALRPHFTTRALQGAALAALIGLFPSFAILGPGNAKPRTYWDYGVDKPVWEAVRALPKHATIAANIYHADRIPLFSVRQVYINRDLSQPWRMGYYEECERRMYALYRALYATDWEVVADFVENEGIDFFVYAPSQLRKMDKRMKEPMMSVLRKEHARNLKDGLVMMEPLEESIVWSHKGRGVVILDAKKLVALVRNPPPSEPAPDATDSETDAGEAPSAIEGGESSAAP